MQTRNMKKIKTVIMLIILSVTALVINMQKSELASAPSLEQITNIPLSETREIIPTPTAVDNALSAEPFGLDATEVSGQHLIKTEFTFQENYYGDATQILNANIESAESFSELYIEE